MQFSRTRLIHAWMLLRQHISMMRRRQHARRVVPARAFALESFEPRTLMSSSGFGLPVEGPREGTTEPRDVVLATVDPLPVREATNSDGGRSGDGDVFKSNGRDQEGGPGKGPQGEGSHENPGAIVYNHGVVQIFGTDDVDWGSIDYYLGGTPKYGYRVILSNPKGAQLKVFTEVTAVEFYGYAGADRFINNTAVPSYAEGGHGEDTLSGGSGPDELRGGESNDTLMGWGGEDIIYGGSGSDTIEGGQNKDTLAGNDGNDTIGGGSGNDEISGGKHEDQIFGDDGNDTLSGDGGNDTVRGGNHNDTISGGTGKDRLYGDDGEDDISGDDDDDLIVGGDDDDTLNGGANNDELYGGDGDDEINGDGGNDILFGQDGDDTLNGNGGHDDLYGGDHDDELNGGSGRDGLFGDWGTNTLNGGSDADRLLTRDSGAGINFTDLGNVSSSDAVLRFVSGDKGWATWEIEATDKTLRLLHDRTGNTKLLKTHDGNEITYERHISHPDYAAQNVGPSHARVIKYFDTALDPGDTHEDEATWLARVTIHELAHNWDTWGDSAATQENPTIPLFRSFSGWTQSPPGTLDDGWFESFYESGWWFNVTLEGFASSYAADYPWEDFAEAVSAVVMAEEGMVFTQTGSDSVAPGVGGIPQKAAMVTEWLNGL